MLLKGFLHEPFAAMISHFYDPERKLASIRDQRVLVFDWRGGTLDVCIVQMSKDGSKILELAHEGIEDRAGDDFDHRIMASLRASFLGQHDELDDEELELKGDVRDRFWLNAEAGKISLSSAQKTAITVATFFQKNGTIYDLQESLTRSEFESLIAAEVDAAVRCVQRCLTRARVTPGCIDHLLMVGGTSNIPLVREKLEALFGHKVQVTHEPDAAIARGAAIVAAKGWRPFNALALGVKLSDSTFLIFFGRAHCWTLSRVGASYSIARIGESAPRISSSARRLCQATRMPTRLAWFCRCQRGTKCSSRVISIESLQISQSLATQLFNVSPKALRSANSSMRNP
jgi:molecular chaperone DnaK